MFAVTITGGMANNAAPDVVKVPAPPAPPVPTPLVNIAAINMIIPLTASKKVWFSGGQAAQITSVTAMSSGDEPGVAGGVVSGMFIQAMGFMLPGNCQKVFVENVNAVGMGCQTTHNGNKVFNTTGSCSLVANFKVDVS
ncbi:MAG: DUF4150 domain-containing protein [Deltaproteobacteria bacterium]|jgi:hypothetical protein|nr:DUF4150 domain-containing protein [Deltaproteobacteria bacterium]